MTSRTLANLQKLTTKLGLEVKQTGNRVSKKDYVVALQKHYLVEKYPEGVPSWLKARLSMDSPMLCAQITGLKPEQADAVWNSDEWVFEEKINGVRMLLFWNGETLNACSRNLSLEDFLPLDYSEKFLFREELTQKLIENNVPKFILDTEITFSNPNVRTYLYNSKGVETATMLQAVAAVLALNTEASLELQKDMGNFEFNVFDAIYVGESLRNQTYGYRYKKLTEFHSEYAHLFDGIFKLPNRCTDSAKKKDFYEGILAQGGEGVVAKNVRGTYISSLNRNKLGWVKIKRSVAESLAQAGLADSVDGYISGFELADDKKSWSGLIGSLRISVTLISGDGEKEHEIARVANIPLDLRREMTEIVDGEPRLKEEYYGKVVEVDGQAMSARAFRLTHPRLLGFRPDRTKYDCQYDVEYLKSLVV